MIRHKHISKVMALSDQMIVSGTNFVIGILITRLAGIEDYGRYSLYWMIFLFLLGFCNSFIGLPSQIISNQVANKFEYLEENNRLGNLSLTLLLFLLYTGFYIYDSLYSSSFGYGYWIFPMTIVIFLKQEMNRKYFYAKLDLKKVISIDFSAYLLQIPSLLILTQFYDITLDLIITNITLFGIMGQVVFQFLKPRYNSPFRLKKMPYRENWSYSKHLIFTSILQWFSGNILIISAGGIIGLSAVGILRVLQNIMGALHILFLTMENVIPVKASILLNNHGKQHMFNYFKKVFVVAGIVYGIILLVLKVSGEFLLSFLYGESYLEYSGLLDLFIYLYILVFIGTIAQLIIKTLKLNYGISIAYALTVIAAFAISTTLLNTFGIKGVILGLGIFQLITISTYLFIIKRNSIC